MKWVLGKARALTRGPRGHGNELGSEGNGNQQRRIESDSVPGDGDAGAKVQDTEADMADGEARPSSALAAIAAAALRNMSSRRVCSAWNFVAGPNAAENGPCPAGTGQKMSARTKAIRAKANRRLESMGTISIVPASEAVKTA
jgi:hypothetical protein